MRRRLLVVLPAARPDHLVHVAPLLLLCGDKALELTEPGGGGPRDVLVEGGHEDGDVVAPLGDERVAEHELAGVVGVLLGLLGRRGVLHRAALVLAPALLVVVPKVDLKSAVHAFIVGADVREQTVERLAVLVVRDGERGAGRGRAFADGLCSDRGHHLAEAGAALVRGRRWLERHLGFSRSEREREKESERERESFCRYLAWGGPEVQ